jgi:hypothetical protein
MRRLVTYLALAAFFSSLLLSLAATFQRSGTPACCLPGGKHHCRQHPSGPGFNSQNDKCPYASLAIAARVQMVGADHFDFAPPSILTFFDLVDVESACRSTAGKLSARGPPEFSL